MGSDLRFALRNLAKRPGLSIAATLALALGIGANSAIFSVVNAVLLNPFPYGQTSRLVMVWETQVSRGRDKARVAPAKFEFWKKQTQLFESLTAMSNIRLHLTAADEPLEIRARRVTSNFFQALGLQMVRGRPFAPEEQQLGNHRVVVVGEGLWKRRFNSDEDVVGQTLSLDDQPYLVVGIAPQTLDPIAEVDAWIPLALDSWQSRAAHFLTVIGRLNQQTSLEQAREALAVLARQLEDAYPETDAGWGVRLAPLREELVSGIRPALLVLFGAVICVLLIACANVAALLLARSQSRRKEIAVRTALGAGRLHILRLLLCESLCLAGLGAALGLLLAYTGTKALLALSPHDIPRLGHVAVDSSALLFTAGAALAAGIISGLAPFGQAGKVDLNEALKDEGRSFVAAGAFQRSFSRLMIGEVALALVLLIGAGLMMKSFVRLQRVTPGFEPDNVLTVSLSLPYARYPRGPGQAEFFGEVLDQVGSLPGVRSVGAISRFPFSGLKVPFRFLMASNPRLPLAERPTAEYRVVSKGYFQSMGIPLVQGMDLRSNAQDGVVINQMMARRFWPGEDPVGQRISVDGPEGPWLEIVGVVGDVKYFGLAQEAPPQFYRLFEHDPWSTMALAVRCHLNPLDLAPAVRSAIWAVDSQLPVSNIQALQQILSASLSRSRFNMTLLNLFAGLAVTLTVVGLYGTMAYSISLRSHEIGIRMSVGAGRKQILGMLLKKGFKLSIAGVALGLASSLVLTRLLSSLLFDVSVTDPIIFAAVSVCVAGLPLATAYIPARKAARADPLTALHDLGR